MLQSSSEPELDLHANMLFIRSYVGAASIKDVMHCHKHLRLTYDREAKKEEVCM